MYESAFIFLTLSDRLIFVYEKDELLVRKSSLALKAQFKYDYVSHYATAVVAGVAAC